MCCQHQQSTTQTVKNIQLCSFGISPTVPQQTFIYAEQREDLRDAETYSVSLAAAFQPVEEGGGGGGKTEKGGDFF